MDVIDIRKLEAIGLAQGMPLMEMAGSAAAEFVTQKFPAGSHVVLLVGPGNNGGDALTAGRILQNKGYEVTAVMPQPPGPTAKDARRALDLWLKNGNPIKQDLLDAINAKRPDLFIDGLFGIGLNKPLDTSWQAMIDNINSTGIPVLALDIPSGIQADSCQTMGRPVIATWTVSFIAATRAMYDPSLKKYIGQWHVCTLGLKDPDGTHQS